MLRKSRTARGLFFNGTDLDRSNPVALRPMPAYIPGMILGVDAMKRLILPLLSVLENLAGWLERIPENEDRIWKFLFLNVVLFGIAHYFVYYHH
jgi:hypothetical protein